MIKEVDSGIEAAELDFESVKRQLEATNNKLIQMNVSMMIVDNC